MFKKNEYLVTLSQNAKEKPDIMHWATHKKQAREKECDVNNGHHKRKLFTRGYAVKDSRAAGFLGTLVRTLPDDITGHR
jgi:hypothetical protein